MSCEPQTAETRAGRYVPAEARLKALPTVPELLTRLSAAAAFKPSESRSVGEGLCEPCVSEEIAELSKALKIYSNSRKILAEERRAQRGDSTPRKRGGVKHNKHKHQPTAAPSSLPH